MQWNSVVEMSDPWGSTASPPPQALVPDRQRLSSTWVPSDIKSNRAVVQLRKIGEPLKKRNSQVLWLISDSERTLQNRPA